MTSVRSSEKQKIEQNTWIWSNFKINNNKYRGLYKNFRLYRMFNLLKIP